MLAGSTVLKEFCKNTILLNTFLSLALVSCGQGKGMLLRRQVFEKVFGQDYGVLRDV